MMRVCRKLIFVLLVMASAPIISAFQEATERDTPFQWLDTSGGTSGVKYRTKKLQALSPKYEIGTPLDIEEQKVEVDAQTTRITRREYMPTANRNRELIGTVVVEIQKLPDGRTRAVRTTSRKDVNGRLNPAKQEIQEIVPSGTDSCRITKTLLLPEPGGRFVERERIQQTERSRGDSNVDIELTRYEPDVNGKWSAMEHRVSKNMLDGERTQTEEQIFQNDINNRMALTERVEAREWIDSNGRRHQTSDSYTMTLGGELQLSSRTTIVQMEDGNGRQETTEIVESTNSANPGEGLKAIRKIVENRQNLSRNETAIDMEVLEPGLDGGWESVHSEQSVEQK